MNKEDYLRCKICDEIFLDWSDHSQLCDCGLAFCSEGCADLSETDDYKECCVCRKENNSDAFLFKVLLKHLNLTREDVIKIWRGKKG